MQLRVEFLALNFTTHRHGQPFTPKPNVLISNSRLFQSRSGMWLNFGFTSEVVLSYSKTERIASKLHFKHFDMYCH